MKEKIIPKAPGELIQLDIKYVYKEGKLNTKEPFLMSTQECNMYIYRNQKIQTQQSKLYKKQLNSFLSIFKRYKQTTELSSEASSTLILKKMKLNITLSPKALLNGMVVWKERTEALMKSFTLTSLHLTTMFMNIYTGTTPKDLTLEKV